MTATVGHPPVLVDVGDPPGPALLWRLDAPMRAISSSPLGGGTGTREWVLNAQVPSDYARTDPVRHLVELAGAIGCTGDGIGFLTAATVADVTRAADDDVVAFATVGLQVPTWAAAPADAALPEVTGASRPGTINLVVFVPTVLGDAALVNTLVTATEAKAQALLELGVAGTGTASDAVCVLTPTDGAAEAFAGPRSRVGASIARAVHGAVSAGASAWLAARSRA